MGLGGQKCFVVRQRLMHGSRSQVQRVKGIDFRATFQESTGPVESGVQTRLCGQFFARPRKVAQPLDGPSKGRLRAARLLGAIERRRFGFDGHNLARLMQLTIDP